MPVLTAPQKVLLRTHPHRIKLKLAILKPTAIYSALVNDGGASKGDRIITFDGGVGTIANIRAGMSLWISDGVDGAAGMQDKGRVRVKAYTDGGGGTGTIIVAQNDHIDWEDDDFLTVRGIHEFWVAYPHITNSGGLDFFKDFGTGEWLDYTDENLDLNPVPIMGPPACAEIDPDTGLATVYFDGQDSYCLGSGVDWGAQNSEWTFPGGTPATSNLATPGNVTWSVAKGHIPYMVMLKSKATNGKITYGYRPVFIFDENNPPYTNFVVKGARCSAKDGGWSHSYEVHGDADAGEFPEGTMAVLFAEAYYGDTLKDFGMNHPGRHNIRGVGWIVKESVKKQPETGVVTFETQGVVGLMKSRQNFMCALDYVSGTPSDWYELKEMDTDRALFHYLYWHSTVFNMTDVRVSGEIHPACAGPFKIKFQDFARGSIWAGLSKLCEEAFLIPVADRASCLYLDYNPQVLLEAEREEPDTVMLLTHADRGGDLAMSRLLEKKTNFVDFEGIAFDGTDAEPVISYAPGKTPEYSGGPRPSKRHILDPAGDWQAKANVRAGLKLAWDNNPWPEIRWPAAGDYSVGDIAPREWFDLTLLAGDTKRGVEWDEQKLLVAAINERYDVARGTVQTQFTFEREAIGPPGVTGDYPPDEPPEDGDDEPEEPPDEGDWRAKVYLATKVKGIYYTENFSGPGAPMPTWETVNDGLGTLNTRAIVGDPFGPKDRQYARTTEPKIYIRENGGPWSMILDGAIINALAIGPSVGSLKLIGPKCNINATGHVYVLASFQDGGAYGNVLYFLKSTNYGAAGTWSAVRVHDVWAITVTAIDLAVGAFKGSSSYPAGYVIYAVFRTGLFANLYMRVSVDQGTIWGSAIGLYNCAASGVGGELSRSPADQDIIYQVGWGSDVGGERHTLVKSSNRGGSFVVRWVCAFSPEMTQRPSVYMWDPTEGYMAGGAYKLYWTEEDWVTYETHTNTEKFRVDKCSRVTDAPEKLYGLCAFDPDTQQGEIPHVIAASINRGDDWEGKAGPNAGNSPYVDSIPDDCGGAVSILQVWTT